MEEESGERGQHGDTGRVLVVITIVLCFIFSYTHFSLILLSYTFIVYQTLLSFHERRGSACLTQCCSPRNYKYWHKLGPQ